MLSTLTDALKGFLSRYPDAHADHRRVRGWLLDHAPTEKRAVHDLATVAAPTLARWWLHMCSAKRKPEWFQGFERSVEGVMAGASDSPPLSADADGPPRGRGGAFVAMTWVIAAAV